MQLACIPADGGSNAVRGVVSGAVDHPTPVLSFLVEPLIGEPIPWTSVSFQRESLVIYERLGRIVHY